jgi:signal transduction histidine kinase
LQNLVTNAVEATAKKTDGLIEVGAWAENSRLFITVKDNGPGLPDAVVDHMFEPFSTHGKLGGTGLGMAIVKNVVNAHRGHITFKTARGEGTSFMVDLPQFGDATHAQVPEEAPEATARG